MDLAYSGLHQLCAPLLDHLDELPVPQRDALATVFRLSTGPAPDRFLVGLATTRGGGDRRGAVRRAGPHSWRGQAREGRELIDVTIGEASARGEGVGVAICEYSHAVLCNGLGQYDEALAAARGACADPTEMVAHNTGMVELIESAMRSGRTDLAAEAVARLTTKAQACRTDWALGIEARSRALLSTGDTAEREFREAVGHLSRARVHGELARAYLLYGEWLRQDGRQVDARRELTRAYEMFTAIGVEGFMERTRRELRPLARPYASALPMPSSSSRSRRHSSRGWPATACRIRRSAPSFSLAPARSNGICARCSPSWASALVGSCGWLWPITVGRWQPAASTFLRCRPGSRANRRA